MNSLVKIVTHISVKEAVDFVQSSSCGAINIFIGTVRSNTRGKSVSKLFFESYEPMAIKEMQLIVKQSKFLFGIEKMAIIHAVGNKVVGDQVVVIAVSAPHRQEAFKACNYAIDTLKETVPIWKKEYFDDGEVWVSAYP